MESGKTRQQGFSQGRALPLFPGYVFVKPREEEKYGLLFIPGTCGLLTFRTRPAVVRDREIEAIRVMLADRSPLDLHNGLVPGTRVKVLAGPLSGMEGVLITHRNRYRLAIHVEILNQTVSIEIDREFVVPA